MAERSEASVNQKYFSELLISDNEVGLVTCQVKELSIRGAAPLDVLFNNRSNQKWPLVQLVSLTICDFAKLSSDSLLKKLGQQRMCLKQFFFKN